jgi:hypothetical protein
MLRCSVCGLFLDLPAWIFGDLPAINECHIRVIRRLLYLGGEGYTYPGFLKSF